MASTYILDPPPTSSITLHTTAGPIPISLFSNQTPLTCRNFLQHVLDHTYDSNIFHRISPGFLIQTGDPTGTGSGGENIYEDREFETYDPEWARLLKKEVGEKVVFGDEVHSRLKFNRRGMVGMAKTEDGNGGYGSQFFITLGDCRAELDGQCTLFGRVEAEGIYNVLKIAEGEVVEGTERPVFPERILRVEVGEMPKGEVWEGLKPRKRVEDRLVEEVEKKGKSTAKKGKKTKVLLSFGDEEGGEGEVVKTKKKFNTNLIDGAGEQQTNGNGNRTDTTKAKPQPRSPSPASIPQKRKVIEPSPPRRPDAAAKPDEPQPQPHRRKPSFHDPTTQLPILDPETPSRSPSPVPNGTKGAATLASEIAALKASMRRPTTTTSSAQTHKKSALEALIPATSTRGRKRPRPGDSTAAEDKRSLEMLAKFRRKLDMTSQTSHSSSGKNGRSETHHAHDNHDAAPPQAGEEMEEAVLCDLHFIAHCQSCSKWDDDTTTTTTAAANDHTGNGSADHGRADNDDDRGWLSHQLKFEKDKLGKDLSWKERNKRGEDDGDGLVVIDPRERERELGIKPRTGRGMGMGGGDAKGWEGERKRERERRKGL